MNTTEELKAKIKLTQYSHGAGCGCKIAPDLLHQIIHDNQKSEKKYPNLLVGNETNDDAAVIDLGDGTGIISTTDFFMPIVDDPKLFGKIAATNAISDIYAMGGEPLMAIAIFGWPIEKLSAEIGQLVLQGGREACSEAGIPLAGGHSIDAPEPIFGLAVTGRVQLKYLKRNSTAKHGDSIFLTKPLGIGILTTAEKSGAIKKEDKNIAAYWMTQLNKVGTELGKIPGVTALTDVTGFGLAGHLLEICKGSNLKATLKISEIPLIEQTKFYYKKKQVPGGTMRNFRSYGSDIELTDEFTKNIICDPQTSGGLLITVEQESIDEVVRILQNNNCHTKPIGRLSKCESGHPKIEFSQ